MARIVFEAHGYKSLCCKKCCSTACASADEATEKGVISVLDMGISGCNSLYYKERDYRVKPDNDRSEDRR